MEASLHHVSGGGIAMLNIVMLKLVRAICAGGMLTVAALAATTKPVPAPTDAPVSIVIIFKDGHQETFAMSDIARIEFTGASDSTLGPDYFLGKWEVGNGSSGTFFIKLEPNGEASRSFGASHGVWTVVGDEARISWDDGWHDVIRKIGEAHEKFAFAPGATFSDKPDNVASARKLEP
jgi:hypothetical protein